MVRDHNQIAMAKLLFPLGLGTALSLIGDATLYTVLPTHTKAAAGAQRSAASALWILTKAKSGLFKGVRNLKVE